MSGGLKLRHGGGGGGGGGLSAPVLNSELSDMNQSTIKGRAAGAGSGDPTDLSVAQVKTILSYGMFTTHQVPSGTSPVADSDADTLTYTSTDLTITGNSGTDTIDLELAAQHKLVTLTISINGNGNIINTGIIPGADLKIPFAMTVTEWHLLADVAAAMVIDVWRDTYTNYPPDSGDTFTAAAKPTLASVIKNQNTSPTWGNSNVINAGDILRFNVDSNDLAKYATLSIVGTRT